jgi:hypothetical protein
MPTRGTRRLPVHTDIDDLVAAFEGLTCEPTM